MKRTLPIAIACCIAIIATALFTSRPAVIADEQPVESGAPHKPAGTVCDCQCSDAATLTQILERLKSLEQGSTAGTVAYEEALTVSGMATEYLEQINQKLDTLKAQPDTTATAAPQDTTQVLTEVIAFLQTRRTADLGVPHEKRKVWNHAIADAIVTIGQHRLLLEQSAAATPHQN